MLEEGRYLNFFFKAHAAKERHWNAPCAREVFPAAWLLVIEAWAQSSHPGSCIHGQ